MWDFLYLLQEELGYKRCIFYGYIFIPQQSLLVMYAKWILWHAPITNMFDWYWAIIHASLCIMHQMLQSSSNPLFADLGFNVVLFLWVFWVGGWGWIVCTILFMSILSCTCALDNLCNTHLELIIQGYILLLHQKLNLMHNLWNLWNNYYIDL